MKVGDKVKFNGKLESKLDQLSGIKPGMTGVIIKEHRRNVGVYVRFFDNRVVPYEKWEKYSPAYYDKETNSFYMLNGQLTPIKERTRLPV